MTTQKTFSEQQAKKVAMELGIDWKKVKFDLMQFHQGMNVELEHGTENKLTNVTNDDPMMTGKIALAHLNEFPDYYHRLETLEQEAEKHWQENIMV